MSVGSLLDSLDDWCALPEPGHPPRPEWLHDVLTALVLAELSVTVGTSAESRALYETAAQLYEVAAEKVALNPQPLAPVDEFMGDQQP